METGTVYFFTGLSGAGKTTVGGLFHKRLKARKPNVFWYDGDQMRPILFENVGYTMEERRRACQRGFGLCKAIADQGIDVVVCAIAMHSEARGFEYSDEGCRKRRAGAEPRLQTAHSVAPGTGSWEKS